MFTPFIQALAAALFFYLVVPVLGAFRVRRSWRGFRALMAAAARSPFLDYGKIRQGMSLTGNRATGSGNVLGSYRLFGSIEAMEGKDRLWVRSLKVCGSPVSVSIDMRGALLYSLPGDGSEFESKRDGEGVEPSDYDETAESPERLSWRNLPALPERTKVFVFGKVFLETGKAEFRGNRKDPAIVLIYEGREDSLLFRSIRQGRQANEYWNKLTPISFLAGATVMLLILLSVARGFSLPLVRLLVSLTAFLPLLVFPPPGLFFFFLYRASWKRARSLRASRDLTRLPGAVLPRGRGETALPGGERYLRVWVPVNKPGKAELPGAMPRRGLEEWRRRDGSLPGYTCFGAPDPGKEGHLVRPRDPMADFTAIPGIPEDFAARCSLRARVFTLVAGASLGVAALTNFLLLFLVLRGLI